MAFVSRAPWFCLCLFALLGAISCEEVQSEESSKLLVVLTEHLNKDSSSGQIYKDGSLSTSHKQDDVYTVTVEFSTPCNQEPCPETKVKCRGTIQRIGDELVVKGDETECEAPSNVDAEPPVKDSVSEPVQLAHEVELSDQYNGSGEQFVAVRRDSGADGGSWCAGCPTDVDVSADGVTELANHIVKHLDRHIPAEKHTLKKIVQVQRQAQIVNGVRYIILAEIDSTACNNDNGEAACENNVPNTSLCKVVFLEKPWLKLKDGSKFRAILSNNCTQEYNFGDEGEALTNNGNTNGADDDKDVIKSAHAQELLTAQKRSELEDELTPERIKNVEEQIIDDKVSYVNENVVQATVIQNSQSSLRNEQNKPDELSDDKKEALAGLMDLFDFDTFPGQSETTQNDLSFKSTTKRNLHQNKDSSSEEMKTDKQSVHQGKKNDSSSEEVKKDKDKKMNKSVEDSSEEKKNPTDPRQKRSLLQFSESKKASRDPYILYLAKYAAETIDDLDSDDKKMVVLKVIDSKVTKDDSSLLYQITFLAGNSDCRESSESQRTCASMVEMDHKKICTAEIEIKSDESKKVIISKCAKEAQNSKRSIPGGINNVPLPNPDIDNLAAQSLTHYNSKLVSGNPHKLVDVLSATRQIVAGTLTKIKIQIQETDCTKNHIHDDCAFLKDSSPKTCLSSVWTKPWMNFTQITVTCDEVEKATRRKRDSYQDSIRQLEDLIVRQKMFDKFIKKYSKGYGADGEEYLHRFRVFGDNLDKIDQLNKHELGTGIYDINAFADLTEEEFRRRFLGLNTNLRSENAIPFPKAEIPDLDDIPASFDWRDQGAVTPVKNQEQCGSCWAFSVTGNIEGQYKIKNGQLLSLSEQELVDCDKLDEGCNGGLPDNAYRAIEQLGGLELENDYPYDAKDEKCHFNKSIARVQISGAVNVSSDEVEMAKWMVANGPMSIGINANAMQFYVGGVSHPPKFLCSPKNLDHGVLIVGYGTKNYPLFKKTMPYWIVKNSWGPGWGERGYYRVFRGTGTCGLNMMVSSAVL